MDTSRSTSLAAQLQPLQVQVRDGVVYQRSLGDHRGYEIAATIYGEQRGTSP